MKEARCHCLNLLLQKLFFGVQLEKIEYYLVIGNLAPCKETIFVSLLCHSLCQNWMYYLFTKIDNTYEVVDAPAPISDMFPTS